MRFVRCAPILASGLALFWIAGCRSMDAVDEAGVRPLALTVVVSAFSDEHDRWPNSPDEVEAWWGDEADQPLPVDFAEFQGLEFTPLDDETLEITYDRWVSPRGTIKAVNGRLIVGGKEENG